MSAGSPAGVQLPAASSGAVPATVPSAVRAASGAGEARLLVDNVNAIGPIINAIDNAHRVVNVELFSIGPDGSGAQIGAALARAAQRGVEANLVADYTSWISRPMPVIAFDRWKNGLEAAGVNVKVTNRFSGDASNRVVDHRKVIAVDGTTAFVGGMNFAKFMDGWHDAVFQLSGSAAATVGADELQRMSELGMRITPTHRQAVDDALRSTGAAQGNSTVNVLVNAPEHQRWDVTRYYQHEIHFAKQRVWVASPLFSDPELLGEICAAAKRGVDVRVVAPGIAPVIPALKYPERTALAQILAAGGQVWETPEIAHTKALVTDDKATLGSFNITKRSATDDTEMNIQSSDPSVVGQIEGLFQRDFGRSTPLHLTDLHGAVQGATNFLVNNLHLGY
jgi:cardiolipin synthase